MSGLGICQQSADLLLVNLAVAVGEWDSLAARPRPGHSSVPEQLTTAPVYTANTAMWKHVACCGEKSRVVVGGSATPLKIVTYYANLQPVGGQLPEVWLQNPTELMVGARKYILIV